MLFSIALSIECQNVKFPIRALPDLKGDTKSTCRNSMFFHVPNICVFQSDLKKDIIRWKNTGREMPGIFTKFDFAFCSHVEIVNNFLVQEKLFMGKKMF